MKTQKPNLKTQQENPRNLPLEREREGERESEIKREDELEKTNTTTKLFFVKKIKI